MITEYYTTIGMDVSDRKIQVCVMTKSGVNPKIVTETTIPTTKEGVQKFLSTQDKNTPVDQGLHQASSSGEERISDRLLRAAAG